MTLVRHLVRSLCSAVQIWHLHQAVLDLQVKKSPSKASASTSGGGVSAAEVTDFLSRMFEELLDEGGAVASMDACDTITTPLLPHQKEALAWMMQRENSNALPPFWEPHKVKLATCLWTFCPIQNQQLGPVSLTRTAC